MKILVTGANGLVGRAIARAARGRHELVLADNAPQIKSIGGIQLDILDADALKQAAEGCDAIIHTASLTGNHKRTATERQFLEVNIIGAHLVFQTAIELGIKRVVVSSTLEVLCGSDWQASGVTVYDEQLSPRPDWIYPLSKQLVEELGHYYVRERRLEIIQLRYAWVRDEPVKAIGLGLLARSVASSDVAEANLMACTTPGLTDHIFIIGPESPLTHGDMMAALKDPEPVLEKYWPGSVEVLRSHQVRISSNYFWPVLNVNAARQVMGWRPQVCFEHYLQELGWSPAARPAASAAAK